MDRAALSWVNLAAVPAVMLIGRAALVRRSVAAVDSPVSSLIPALPRLYTAVLTGTGGHKRFGAFSGPLPEERSYRR